MVEKRPIEDTNLESNNNKRQAINISKDSDYTKKNEASGTNNSSSVRGEPQIKKEVTPNYFEKNKKYLCIHCTKVIITLNVDSHTLKCMTCNKITHFNDYYQKNNVIHEKLIQNMEFSWSQLRESNQLNIEKNKKNQETFNKMKEYLSSIDILKDKIREYDKVLCDCENGNTLEVKLFLKRKIRHLENQITSIKKEVETFSVS